MTENYKILIVKAGTTNPPVVAEYGDYDAWFQSSLSDFPIQWHVTSVYAGDVLPDPKLFDGVILTGSPSSVWEREPWMIETIEWLKAILESPSVPVLAVCFGHQLLGSALGVDVVPNPNGAEYGTIEVSLNAEGQSDPLFSGLPEQIIVQSIHKDIIPHLPEMNSIIPFGGTKNTAFQAFGIGENIRSVQFHPELTQPALSMLCSVRDIDAPVSHTSHGTKILHNWFQNWVKL